jgi:hypothetical protein
MMKLAFTILLIVMCSVSSAAHPGTAFVIDKRDNLYFVYWGGTWRLDPKGHLDRIHANDFHFLAIDSTGGFANARLGDGLRITADGSTPSLFSFPEYPATFHSDGSLYVAPWSVGRIRLERISPTGRKSMFVDAAIDPRVARKPGKHEGGVLAVASGPNGFLYVSDGASIWKIDARGAISPVAKEIVVPGCPSDLPAELPKPHIRSLAVDTTGDVLAAAIGCRAVLRISAAGRVTVVLRAETPWSPSAVVVTHGDIYVMEFDNALAERPTDGRPRIRKLARSGQVTVPVVVDTAEGHVKGR